MAGIGTSLQLLERSGLPGDGTTYVGRATRSLDFMRGVLRKVADATSLEAALETQEMRDVDLSRLVAERAEDFGREVAPRRCEITVCDGVHVCGSPDSLLQLLDKLLNNALENSSPDGLIRVSLQTQLDRARLEVMNFGVPLPSDAERLFRPLVSLRAPGEQGHLGLGLYVAQVIANRHGGAIRAEPTTEGRAPGSSSNFRCSSLSPGCRPHRRPAVAPPALGADAFRRCADPREGVADRLDVSRDGVGLDHDPRCLHERRVGDHLARVPQQFPQHPELREREIEFFAVPLGAGRRIVDGETRPGGRTQRVVCIVLQCRDGCDPAQQRLDPHDQVVDRDVLGQVVIRPQAQARDPVDVAVVGGEEHDGQPWRPAAKAAANLEACVSLVTEGDVDQRHVGERDQEGVEGRLLSANAATSKPACDSRSR